MKHYLQIFTLLVINFCSLSLSAQQTPLYSQYFLNPYVYNPAQAGQNGTQAFFQYRKQWVGIQGSPETQAFTIDGKLRDERWGAGLSFFNDISNVIGRTSGALSIAYTIPLSETQKLAFGLSAMVMQNRIYFDRIEVDDFLDPNLLTNIDNQSSIDGNAGISYQWKNLHVGIAAQQLFQNDIKYENAAQFQSLNFQYVRHYLVTASYDFDLGSNFSLRPLVLMRTAEGLTPQMDVSTILDYKNIVWLGATYRHEIGVGTSLGFTIDDRFIVGYNYELPTSDLNVVGTTSHEFVLGIKIGSGERNKSKSDYSDSSPRRKLSDEDAAQYETIDALQQVNERQEKKLADYEKIINRQDEELRKLRSLYESFESNLNVLKSQSELPISYQSEESPLPDPESQYYLVVGAFRELDNVKLFQKVMKRDGGLTTQVVQNNLKTWYLIYTEEMKDLTGVKEKIRALERGPAQHLINGNPWIFVRSTKDLSE